MIAYLRLFFRMDFCSSLHFSSSVAFWRGDMDTLPQSFIDVDTQFVHGLSLHGGYLLVCVLECILGI